MSGEDMCGHIFVGRKCVEGYVWGEYVMEGYVRERYVCKGGKAHL